MFVYVNIHRTEKCIVELSGFHAVAEVLSDEMYVREVITLYLYIVKYWLCWTDKRQNKIYPWNIWPGGGLSLCVR